MFCFLGRRRAVKTQMKLKKEKSVCNGYAPTPIIVSMKNTVATYWTFARDWTVHRN